MLTLARQQQRQNIRWLLCLSVLMLLALLLSLCAGEQWISPGDWFTPRGELF
ncbi:TPA: vitamin B12 ABC transporter permease BtuC, partial [Escherichia coli]